jgi:hypothetical protein
MKTINKLTRTLLCAFLLVVFLSACTTPPATTGNGTDSPATDTCLEGVWLMESAILDLLLASIVPVPGLSVPAGQLAMEFSGDRYTYTGAYTIRFETGSGQYIEADANHLNSGTFSTENGQINFVSEGSESEALVWTAYNQGEVVTSDGTGPEFSIPEPGGGPYKCNENSLEIATRGGTGDPVTMFFAR